MVAAMIASKEDEAMKFLLAYGAKVGWVYDVRVTSLIRNTFLFGFCTYWSGCCENITANCMTSIDKF